MRSPSTCCSSGWVGLAARACAAGGVLASGVPGLPGTWLVHGQLPVELHGSLHGCFCPHTELGPGPSQQRMQMQRLPFPAVLLPT